MFPLASSFLLIIGNCAFGVEHYVMFGTYSFNTANHDTYQCALTTPFFSSTFLEKSGAKNRLKIFGDHLRVRVGLIRYRPMCALTNEKSSQTIISIAILLSQTLFHT
jgi:hypothetical protein